MNSLGLTTSLVDLAPRMVQPFSPQHALWLELTGALLVSFAGVLLAALRAAAARRGERRRTPRPGAVPARRPLPLRPGLSGEVL